MNVELFQFALLVFGVAGVFVMGLSLTIRLHYEKKYRFINDRFEFQKWLTEKQDEYIKELEEKRYTSSY